MPCRVDLTPEEEAQAKEDAILNTKTYKKLKNELDNVTAMLCAVLGTAEKEISFHKKQGTSNKVSTLIAVCFQANPLASTINNWWQKHKQSDLIRQAKSKLTKEEIEALGLKDA